MIYTRSKWLTPHSWVSFSKHHRSIFFWDDLYRFLWGTSKPVSPWIFRWISWCQWFTITWIKKPMMKNALITIMYTYYMYHVMYQKCMIIWLCIVECIMYCICMMVCICIGLPISCTYGRNSDFYIQCTVLMLVIGMYWNVGNPIPYNFHIISI